MGSVLGVAKTGAPDAKRIQRIKAMYADEIGGSTLFRGLAQHADEQRRDVFLQLAAAEERHAEHWARLLRQEGIEPRRPRTSFRVRSLCLLARYLGTEAVLPLMLRTEAAEADRYRDESEATDTMAAQEAAAGRTIAAMQGIPEGGRIARSEGRHRAEIGGALRATVFGVNDGLVSNFSLVMGIAGGTTNNSIIVLAGVAGLVAGAFSMSSGEWISVRSQRELYENELRIELEELQAFPEEEREELELIYRAKGISADAARARRQHHEAKRRRPRHPGPRGAGHRPRHPRFAVDRGELVVRVVRVRSAAPAAAVLLRQWHRGGHRVSGRFADRALRCWRRHVDLHQPPRRARRPAHGGGRRHGRAGHVLHRRAGSGSQRGQQGACAEPAPAMLATNNRAQASSR